MAKYTINEAVIQKKGKLKCLKAVEGTRQLELFGDFFRMSNDQRLQMAMLCIVNGKSTQESKTNENLVLRKQQEIKLEVAERKVFHSLLGDMH